MIYIYIPHENTTSKRDTENHHGSLMSLSVPEIAPLKTPHHQEGRENDHVMWPWWPPIRTQGGLPPHRSQLTSLWRVMISGCSCGTDCCCLLGLGRGSTNKPPMSEGKSQDITSYLCVPGGPLVGLWQLLIGWSNLMLKFLLSQSIYPKVIRDSP